MSHRYTVIGSGRQGTAAAYDLARFGDAESILLADQSLTQAERASSRVNQLVGRRVASPVQLEVQDEDAAVQLLRDSHTEVFISGVPYFYNLKLAHAAIQAQTSMCDFGGNTEQVQRQLALDAEARAAGITLIPDCGQVPGLGTSLCAFAMTLFDETPRGGVPVELAVPGQVFVEEGVK